MIALKWILVAAVTVYLGGVAALYFKQRDMLFPIPPVGRTTPEAAGFPEAEEHFLGTADVKDCRLARSCEARLPGRAVLPRQR